MAWQQKTDSEERPVSLSCPKPRSDAPKVATADTSGHINNDTANIANYDFGADWNGQDGNVTTVGSGGSGSASYYGAFDMAGNVTEWTEQVYITNWGIYRVGRGGALSSYYGNLREHDSDPIPPTDERNYFGFRVASS